MDCVVAELVQRYVYPGPDGLALSCHIGDNEGGAAMAVTVMEAEGTGSDGIVLRVMDAVAEQLLPGVVAVTV
jgi:hypothetical protein